jgi:hypothetical protein
MYIPSGFLRANNTIIDPWELHFHERIRENESSLLPALLADLSLRESTLSKSWKTWNST